MLKIKKYIISLLALGLAILNLNVCAKNSSHSFIASKSKQTHNNKSKKLSDKLVLDGTKNTRYLAIYDDADGNPLNHEAFIRSDNTNNLSEDDLSKLKKLNVKTVIDLRYPNETNKAPDKFANVEWVKYHNLTLAVNKKYSFYDRYIKALECKKLIKNIFETISNADEGTILFHCTYGKERTGILAMLLLGVANVENEHIIKNYSDCYCTGCSPEKYNKKYKKCKENMKKVIEYITDKYDSFDNYLLSTGLSEENLYKVKNRINPKLDCFDSKLNE